MMQRSASGSYVCWRCLSRGLQPKPSLVRRPFSAAASRNLSAFRARGTRTFATVQDPLAQSNENTTAEDPTIEPDEAAPFKATSIRHRLQEWAAQNQLEAPQPMAFDNGVAGRASNTNTRPRVSEDSMPEYADSASRAEQRFAEPGSLDLLPPPSTFQPGDLVEYYGNEGPGGLPLLAIYLGFHNGCMHFYSSTGKWYPSNGLQSRFHYRNFASLAEVNLVVEKLPQTDLPLETLKELSRMDMGPDRITGAALLRRMTDFQQMTDQILQKYATRFEKAHQIVADTAGDQRHLTLEQLRQILLLKNDRKSPAPAHLLYAVHRTISYDDIGFRFVGVLGTSSEWLYEVTAPEDVTLMQNMQTLVRLFTDIPGREGTSLSSLTRKQLTDSQLGRFVLKARDAIDINRESRDWTPHGMLGPAKQHMSKADVAWTGVDMSILHFLLLWAGYDQFSASSRFHWIGSAILRAIGRYKDTEYLSATTAWTFLQEIGYVTPWDVHERFSQRVPGAKISRERGFAPFQLGPEGIKPFLSKDVFDGKRHDWASLKAFAIDSQDTVDVDDAVSLEATDVPDQHWVHIHVADPASRVRHQNALGQRVSVTPLTLYLPGHYSNMWGLNDEIQKLFSLSPGRNCLTFSGLLNDEGQLLEYKITPGKLQDFVYMTPQDANAAVGAEEPRQTLASKASQIKHFSVGDPPAKEPPNRKMTTPSELQPVDLESLKTLYRLADAQHRRHLASGAVPSWSAKPEVKASFKDTSIERTRPGLMTCNGDPYIEVSWETGGSSMIGTMMVVAGEIAARWSAERNIPIPYLSQPDSVKNADALKNYTENVYYPLLTKGEEPSQEHWAQLRTLTGPDQLSTTPGPHFLMGLDSYTKVTSPLRRYSDLVAHWQIEAALAHEMETGTSAEAKLPFTREELDTEVFPWLRLRQEIINRLSRWAGNEAYMMQALVRAWKFPSSSSAAAAESKLPETFRLTIKYAQHGMRAHAHSIFGALDFFGLEAWLTPQSLGPLGLSVADIRQGDVLDVRLLNVNVHMREVTVEAVGKVSVQKHLDEAEP